MTDWRDGTRQQLDAGRVTSRTVQIETRLPAGVVRHYTGERHAEHSAGVRTYVTTVISVLKSTSAASLHTYIYIACQRDNATARYS